MMNTSSKKILLHAFGNSGRGDDGLGNEFISRIEQWIEKNNLHSIDTESSFQLNIEHAAGMADHDIVIFVDASKADIPSYSFDQVFSKSQYSFTSHSISPSILLSVCKELYDSSPLVYLLQIKGYQWEFGAGLSTKASKNLQNAIKFVKTTVASFQNQE
jgi:hydrogenase maturation protease